MLNEIKEVNGYLFDPADREHAYNSMNAKLLCKSGNLNGLDHAMTMVARYFLFEDGAEGEQAVMRASAALRMWCGLMPETLDESMEKECVYLKEKYPQLDGWLPNWLEQEGASENGPNSDDLADSLRKLENNRWGFESFLLSWVSEKNDFKQVSYEKIIANALVAWGPLRKYYLVCRDPKWSSEIKKLGDKNSKNKYVKVKDKDKDKILKLIALYLIESGRKRKQSDSISYEPINMTVLSTWMGTNTKFSKGKFVVYTISEKALFDFEMGKSKNQMKVRPDSDWFEKCGWALIDATEGDDALDAYLKKHPDAVFYSCEGRRTSLREKTRYKL